jgi:integrase
MVDEYISDAAAGVLSRWKFIDRLRAKGELIDGKPLHANTIDLRLAAINMLHNMADLPSPTRSKHIAMTKQGIMRVNGRKSIGAKALTPEMLLKKLMPCDHDTMLVKRDKVMLLLGFAGAFRRSELAALKVGDIEFLEKGMRVFIARQKNDQKGLGYYKPIVNGRFLCPVKQLKHSFLWFGIDHENVSEQEKQLPLFRKVFNYHFLASSGIKGQAVNEACKRVLGSQYTGHSLRAGFITTALGNGADSLKVAEITGHKTPYGLKDYVREAGQFNNNAGEGIL